jgi:ATP-binding cassette subfamily C protein CydCD
MNAGKVKLFDKRLLQQAEENFCPIVLTVGLGVLGGALVILQASYLSQVIRDAFLEGGSLIELISLLGGLAGIFLLRAVLSWGGEVAAHAITQRIKSTLRRQLFQKILDLGPAYARGESTGELNSVMVEGIEALEAYFSKYLPQVILAGLIPLISLAVVFPIDWLSGLILLVTAPLIPLFMILIGDVAQALTRRQWQALSRMSAYFLDVIQGLPTLKMLGRSQEQNQVITEVGDRYCRTTMSVLRVTFLSALVLEMLATLSTAVIAVEVGLRLLYNRLAFEQAFFVLLLAPEFYLPLRLLGTRFHAGMAGVAAAKRIFEILDAPKEVRNEERVVRSEKPGARKDGDPIMPDVLFSDIHFNQVQYSYAGDQVGKVNPAVLDEVTFTIKAGQRAALVGLSGAGKSTIASLLLRFITPVKGLIMVGDDNLEQISPEAWRDQVAWVPQMPYLFNDTVATNIRLARPEATLDEVIQAAQQAGADEFIQALPGGYDTVIGEQGARLSGGQAQRIALARAFLKNAPLVILDEPMAHLDPQLEAELQTALDRLLKNRTVILIAHRLSSVIEADQLIVLDGGRVAQRGTPGELLAQEGLYRRLFAAAQHLSSASEPIPSDILAPARRAIPPNARATLPADDLAPTLQNNPASPPPLRRLLELVSPYTRRVTLSVLLGFATVGSNIGLMAASAYIISAAALHPSIAVLQVAIVSVRFFGIARGVFRYLERYTSHQLTFQLLSRLRTWFYCSLEPLAPARILGHRSGDLLARIVGDIGALEDFYVRSLSPPLVAFLTTLVMFVFMASFDLRLALILAGFTFLGGCGVPYFIRRQSQTPGRQVVERRAALNSTLVDGIQGLADVLAFGQGENQARRVEKLSQDLASAQKRMASLSGLQAALASLSTNLGLWTVLVFAIPLVHSGQVPGVYLAVLVLAALTSFEAVLPLSQAAQRLEVHIQSAQRLFQVVDTKPEVCDSAEPSPMPETFDLEVRNLSFRYPSGVEVSSEKSGIRSVKFGAASEKLGVGIEEVDPGWMLEDISFRLPRGTRLAVVGPSGAGKTTLVNLLLRFWEYHQGQILLDGKELQEYAQDEVRSRIAVVSQNTYLFNASISDNLRLARPEASQEELEWAARKAQIHDFIRTLPDGYDTWIGEQGLRLSGGQRQRLAIARALLKNAPLMILDEPAANLDALTERGLQDALGELMEDRATLLISHRLLGLEAMDVILVMDGGRIVERGRHQELLDGEGLYRKMWDLQNQALVG